MTTENGAESDKCPVQPLAPANPTARPLSKKQARKQLKIAKMIERREIAAQKKLLQPDLPPIEQRTGRGRDDYTEDTKANAVMESFYNDLFFAGAETDAKVAADKEAYWAAFRRSLPVAFRISQIIKGESDAFQGIIESQYLDGLDEALKKAIEDTPPTDPAQTNGFVKPPVTQAAPKRLHWMPGNPVYQLLLDRRTIRSSKPLQRLHEMLITEVETGNVSRQEAVSMIPPMLLDVQPHHKVLDMCAAPGSKTAQLVELLYAGSDSNTPEPTGFVLANDADNKRCYTMVHQIKRLRSPNFLISNHDASQFPTIHVESPKDSANYVPLTFDRVLCDVPCTGDGTLRKNNDVWKKWNPNAACELHKLQLRILRRGIELTSPDKGKLVYSTCSMNPVEDEAVIAALLRECQGRVRLVSLATENESSSDDGTRTCAALPGLKYWPGLSRWHVISKDGQTKATVLEETKESMRGLFSESMFPPSKDSNEDFHLERCMRLAPHHQDTGGFFVAVLEKTGLCPWQSERKWLSPQGGSNKVDASDTERSPPDTPPAAKKSKQTTEPKPKGGGRVFKEDPFFRLSLEDKDWPVIKDFYGLSDSFPRDQILVRHDNEEGKPTISNRRIYFTCATIADILTNTSAPHHDKCKFVNAGVRIFSKGKSPITDNCHYRPDQEAVHVLVKYATKRRLQIQLDDVLTLLQNENPFFTEFNDATAKILEDTEPGSLILEYHPKTDEKRPPFCPIVMAGWRGKSACRCFVANFMRSHFLRMCGVHVSNREDKWADAIKAKTTTKVEDDDENVDC